MTAQSLDVHDDGAVPRRLQSPALDALGQSDMLSVACSTVEECVAQFLQHGGEPGPDRLALLRCAAWLVDAAQRARLDVTALLDALPVDKATPQLRRVVLEWFQQSVHRSQRGHTLPAPAFRQTEDEFVACLPPHVRWRARAEAWHAAELATAQAAGYDIPVEVLGAPALAFSQPACTGFDTVIWDRASAAWLSSGTPHDAATAWSRQHWDRWAAGLSYEEFEALQYYKHGWIEPTTWLRGLPMGPFDRDALRRRIQVMDDAIGRVHLPHDTVFWRGSDSRFMQTWQVGAFHRFMGYISCSLLKEFAERWGVEDEYYPAIGDTSRGMLEFRVPAAYPMVYAEYFWRRGNQYEFILQRGVVWRVDQIIPRDEHGYFRAVVSVLPRVAAHAVLDAEPWLRPRYTSCGLDIDMHFPLV